MSGSALNGATTRSQIFADPSWSTATPFTLIGDISFVAFATAERSAGIKPVTGHLDDVVLRLARRRSQVRARFSAKLKNLHFLIDESAGWRIAGEQLPVELPCQINAAPRMLSGTGAASFEQPLDGLLSAAQN